jgi:hypothetical protein
LTFFFAGILTLTAQNPLPQVETNQDNEVTELLNNTISEGPEMVTTNDFNSRQMEETDSLVDTNDPSGKLVPPAERESRRQWLSRQRAGSGKTPLDAASANGQGATNSAVHSDGVPVRPPYSSFQTIAQRNIFDPNRRSSRGRSYSQPAKAVESIALVGIMSYEKGTYAFFDGTSSSYRKTLQNNDSIAGYKIAEIAPDGVKLAAGTNQVELHVGMKLRRQSEGEWEVAPQSEAFADAPVSSGKISTPDTSSNTAQAAAAGADNDVLERLRKKREQE